MSNQSPREAATAREVRRLASHGVLTPAQAAATERVLRGSLAWRVWIERLLLFLGAVLLLAGVVFFFAFNWHRLSPMEKFALVEAALLACALAAWWRFDALTGKVFLLAASLLVGVFLAVFGQVYQTGADAWQLFATWLVLVLPWTVLGRFGALWIFWIALANVALALAWRQVLFPARWSIEHFPNLVATLALLNGVALAAFELAHRRGADWLTATWWRPLLAVAAFGCVTVSCIAAIFGDWIQRQNDVALPVVALLLLTAGGYVAYAVQRPNLACLAIDALSVCIILCCLAARLVLEGTHDPIGVFFLLGIIVLAIFGGALFWLRSVARRWREGVTP